MFDETLSSTRKTMRNAGKEQRGRRRGTNGCGKYKVADHSVGRCDEELPHEVVERKREGGVGWQKGGSV